MDGVTADDLFAPIGAGVFHPLRDLRNRQLHLCRMADYQLPDLRRGIIHERQFRIKEELPAFAADNGAVDDRPRFDRRKTYHGDPAFQIPGSRKRKRIIHMIDLFGRDRDFSAVSRGNNGGNFH